MRRCHDPTLPYLSSCGSGTRRGGWRGGCIAVARFGAGAAEGLDRLGATRACLRKRRQVGVEVVSREDVKKEEEEGRCVRCSLAGVCGVVKGKGEGTDTRSAAALYDCDCGKVLHRSNSIQNETSWLPSEPPRLARIG